MKRTYLTLAVLVAMLVTVQDALGTVRTQRQEPAIRSLATKIPGLKKLDQTVIKNIPAPAAYRSLAEYVNSPAQRMAVNYNWATMDGQATFHDDYGKAEFNLAVVDYPTGILKATNATDVYALRPYGTTWPYYNLLLENNMINTQQGAMIVDASDYAYVSIPIWTTGTTITWDDGETEDILMVSLNWVMEFIGYNAANVKNSGLGGLNEAGHIYFPCTESVVYTTASILSAAEQGGNILDGFFSCDLDGLYGFYLPGAEPREGEIGANEIQLSTPKYCFDNNQIVLHMKAGSNIKIFRLGFYSAITEDIFEDVIANGQAGEYVAEGDLTLNCAGRSAGNCHIYIAVVAGDAQGNIKDAQFIECYLVPEDNDQWEAEGTAIFVDGIVSPMYNGFTPTAYDVKYQRSKSNPGYIRVVNPYKDFPFINYCQPFSGHNHNHYLYVNATDPTAVVLESAPLGIIVDAEEGEAKASSMAAYLMDIEGKTLAEVKAAGHTGNMDSQKLITFPAKSLFYANVNYQNGALFTTNPNGEFSLKLDASTGNIGVLDTEDVDADAVYYNLQGHRIADPAMVPGIYIKQIPGKPAKKVMIR